MSMAAYDAFLASRTLTDEQRAAMVAALTPAHQGLLSVRRFRGRCFIAHPDDFPWIGWCLVHDIQDDPGHAFDHGRVGTLD
jgi:hypothetical protein